MGGTKRKPKAGEGSVRDAFAWVPSKVHVDHARNFSRGKPVLPMPAELAPYIPGKCSFTIEEIEQRLASLKARGQITACTIYMTMTGDAYLVDGYLRHAALLLAEVRGELSQIPNLTDKMLCMAVTEPKSAADWLALAQRNYAENNERLTLTPVNKARYAETLLASVEDGGFGLEPKDAANELGISSTRQLDRYLRLLKLPPQTLAEVHAGKKSMAAALTESSKTGQADSPGPRKGRSTAKLRRRFDHLDARPFPEQSLSPAGVVALLRDIAGLDVGDDPPADYLAYRDELELTGEEIAAIKAKLGDGVTKRKKTAPPKPGEARP